MMLAFALTALAGTYYHDFTVDGIYYDKISDTEVGVTSYQHGYSSENKYSGKLIVPETIEVNGKVYTVTKVMSYACERCSNLVQVQLPNTIDEIGNDAFELCSSLIKVSLPNNLKKIGSDSFGECRSLINISLPNSLKHIGDGAFRYTPITNIVIPENVDSIGGQAFYGCQNLMEVTLPTSLQYLGGRCFESCALKRIDLSNTMIKSIEPACFENCESLEEVILPEDLYSIRWEAFNRCSQLAKFNVPEGVELIEERAFDGTKWLSNQPSAVYINNIFYKYKGTNSSVVIKEGTKSISPCAFGSNYLGQENKYIKSVTIPEGITVIPYFCFYGCSSLSDIKFPSTIAYFSIPDNGGGNSALEGTKWLENQPDGPVYINDVLYICKGNQNGTIDIKDGTKVITAFAFLDQKYVENINLPQTIEIIDYSAFYRCISLTEITIPKSVKKISNYAFDNTPSMTQIFYDCNGVIAEGEGRTISYKTLEKISLLENVSDFTHFSFSKCLLLESLVVKATMPPAIESSQFTDEQFSELKVIVPKESLELYANHPVWSKFIKLQDETGTSNIEPNTFKEDKRSQFIYNLNGLRVNEDNLPAGIYIKNGKKVFVK